MKKLVVLCLVLCLCFSSFACSDKAAPAATAGTDQATVASVPDEEPASAPAEGDKYVKNPTYEFASTDETFVARDWPEQLSFTDLHATKGPIPKWTDGSAYIHCTYKGMDIEFYRIASNGYDEFYNDLTSAGYSMEPFDYRSGTDVNDAEGQLAAMQAQVAEGGNGVMLYGVTDICCIPALERAHADNMPVYAINSEVPGAYAFVGPNAYNCGELCAEEMAKNLNNQGKVFIVSGLTSQVVGIDRTQGFVDWMAANAPDIEIVAIQSGDWDRAKGYEVASALLLQYPDIDGIYCGSDAMAYGAIQATEQAGLVCGEDVFIVSVDGEGEALEMIRQGRMTATCTLSSFYMGKLAAEVCLRNMMGQDLPRVIWSPYGIFNADNIDLPEAEVVGWTDAELES